MEKKQRRHSSFGLPEQTISSDLNRSSKIDFGLFKSLFEHSISTKCTAHNAAGRSQLDQNGKTGFEADANSRLPRPANAKSTLNIHNGAQKGLLLLLWLFASLIELLQVD